MSISVDVPAATYLGLPLASPVAARPGRCSCLATLLAWMASIHGILRGLGIDDPDVRGDLAELSAEAMRAAGVSYSRQALRLMEGKRGWLPDLVDALGEEGVAGVIDAFISAAQRGDEGLLRRVARMVVSSVEWSGCYRGEALRLVEEGSFNDVAALVAYTLFLEPCEG